VCVWCVAVWLAVDVACALLETCGRFLFRTRHTHQRLSHYLDVMMRLKKVRGTQGRGDKVHQQKPIGLHFTTDVGHPVHI
jgi:hypothetical protein